MRSWFAPALAVGLVSATAAGCATNPVTGKSQLSLVSESQEIEMGRQAAQEVQQSIGFVDDPQLQQYVSRVGLKLAKASERPNLPWEFHVVDDPSVNAFALPGGFIFITRGIMTAMTNEAELATVLGHEIGHVTNRHSVNQISKQQIAQLGLGIGSILSPTVAKYGQLAGAGLNLLFLKYSRDDEKEADVAGFRYALNQNYDVRQMGKVFEMLQTQSQMAGGGGELPTWLATHPDPGSRIEAVQQRLDTLHRSLANTVVDRQQYMQHLQNVVYGNDPRNGYFENGIFYQPQMRIRMNVPNGWQTQNTPQAVLMASPNQDAIIQLSLGQGAPDQAAQQFFAQQGIQSSGVNRTSVNGLPAVAGNFQAQTDQGVVAGTVAFLQYNNATYQILGYTSAQQFGTYNQLFGQVIGSFGPLTDQSKINVSPAHVTLVQLPRAMTIEEFARQYPSSIPLPELALINGVSEGGQLQAGQLYKRVTGGTHP